MLALTAHIALAQEIEPYVIQPGDTLFSIASSRGTTVDALAVLNDLADPSMLSAGQTILVPVVGRQSPATAATPTPTTTRVASPTSTPTQTVTATPSATHFSYVVQPGDSGAWIIRRFGVTAEDLMVANQLTSLDRLAPGDVLRIEQGAAQRASAVPSPTPAVTVAGTLAPARTATASPSRTALPSVSPSSSQAVNVALQYRGAPYVFGGVGPDGFDCSGFVYYVFRQVGQPISRDIFEQYASGSHPLRSELQPGDLVFFQNTYTEGLSHVGIYIGNNQFIHAADESTGVTISNLNSEYWTAHYYGARR